MPESRTQILAAGASAEEAAAITVAIEQFLRDHAPPMSGEATGPPAWQRAALLEGIGLPSGADHPWL